jgi:hypothetical protein
MANGPSATATPAASILTAATTRRHALEHAIAADQAVEKRCPEMRKEGREEQVGEVGVEFAEPRIEHQIMRQDRW